MLPDADEERSEDALADFDLSAELETFGEPLARLDTDALLDEVDEKVPGGVELTVAELSAESVAALVADAESENTLLDGVAEARGETVAMDAEGDAERAELPDAGNDAVDDTDGDDDDVNRAVAVFEADATPLADSLGHADGVPDAAFVADELRDAAEDAETTLALELGVARGLIESTALALVLAV